MSTDRQEVTLLYYAIVQVCALARAYLRIEIYSRVSCQVEHFQGTVGVHQTPRKPGRYAGHLTLSPGDPIPGSLCCVSARQHGNARLAPYIAAPRV